MRTGIPGVATGLAWTPVGGDILFVEAARMPGAGKLILTGQLGDVMKESAQAALSLVKARSPQLGIAPDVFEKSDIHIHVPAGATPKDGPSAGVAMFVALASLLTGRPVRSDVAMTGEISLRGLVLPIGGVKEKVLAALRAGITTVMLPARNRRDLDEIPADARDQLTFVWIETSTKRSPQRFLRHRPRWRRSSAGRRSAATSGRRRIVPRARTRGSTRCGWISNAVNQTMKRDDVTMAEQRAAMPPQAIADDVLLEKYAKAGERTVDEVRRRVARALAAVEVPGQRARWEESFYHAQVDGFIPGGRINSAAGTDLKATLINCFVQPVGDTISNDGGEVGIYAALNEAAETACGAAEAWATIFAHPPARRVRQRHQQPRERAAVYMRVFDESCETVESAGARRGAQMGVLRCDHPDVEAFIHAKDRGDLRNFNLSVAATDAFMRAVVADAEWNSCIGRHRARS